ncbi:MAG: RcnB family protein [Steroidobacterales bacterium]
MTRAAPIAVIASLFAASLSMAGSPPPWTQKRNQSAASQPAHVADSREVSSSNRDNGNGNRGGDNSHGRNSDQSRRGNSDSRGNGGWSGRDNTGSGHPPNLAEVPRQPPGDNGRSRDGGRGNWQGDHSGDGNRDRNRDWDRDHSRDQNRDWDRDHSRDQNRDHNRNWDRDHWRDGRGRDWHHDRNWYDHYRVNHFRFYGGQYYARNRFSIGIYFSPFSYYRARFWLSDGYLPGAYYDSRYYIGDYWSYDLYDPPVGCRWVRVGNDALLVDTFTGEVIDQVYDLFW